MALLDIVMLVMVAGGAFLGWRRRLTGQMGSIVGIIFSVVLCRLFGSSIVDYFTQPEDSVQTRLLHTVLAYLLVGVGSYMAVRISVGLMRSVLRALHLGVIDCIAGAVFNIFQWLLGLSVLLNVWLAMFPDSELRTANRGAVDKVMELAPAIFGSETAKAILNSEFGVTKTSEADADNSEPSL